MMHNQIKTLNAGAEAHFFCRSGFFLLVQRQIERSPAGSVSVAGCTQAPAAHCMAQRAPRRRRRVFLT